MNTSYLWGEDEEWGPRFYFTYYSEFGERRGAIGVEVVILAISFVVAVGANLGIATCVLRYKEMRTPTNLCLVNLAAADLLFTLGVPAIAYTRLTQSWRLGDTVCRLLPYSQFVCGFVLLWTLTFISMDRHRCLAVAPYRSALTAVRVVTVSLLTWVIAALLFLPVAFWFRSTIVGAGDSNICTLIFPRSDIVNISMYFTLPLVILACLLPMVLLVYHYQQIFQKILDTRTRWAVPCVTQGSSGRSGRRDSELSVVGTLLPWAVRKMSTTSISGHQRQGRAGSINMSHHEEIRLHKHLRVVRILLLNVVAVLVMWLPITVVMLLIYVDGSRPSEDTGFFLRSHHFVWTLMIAQLNTVVNPLLYGVFSENFRVCFTKLWRGSVRPESGSVVGRKATFERASSRKSSKSLEGLQNRLPSGKTPTHTRHPPKPPKKDSSCSIGSIVEVPSSEKV